MSKQWDDLTDIEKGALFGLKQVCCFCGSEEPVEDMTHAKDVKDNWDWYCDQCWEDEE